MNPTPAQTTCIAIETSTEGDWVRVSRAGQPLQEGHRLGVCHVAELLRSLGVPTHTMAMREQDTGFEEPQQVPETDTGVAPVVFELAAAGDWVRVSRAGQTLEEGHSLGICHVADLLRSLGFEVNRTELPADAF